MEVECNQKSFSFSLCKDFLKCFGELENSESVSQQTLLNETVRKVSLMSKEQLHQNFDLSSFNMISSFLQENFQRANDISCFLISVGMQFIFSFGYICDFDDSVLKHTLEDYLISDTQNNASLEVKNIKNFNPTFMCEAYYLLSAPWSFLNTSLLSATVPLLITEINLSGKTEEERKRIEIALVALGQISIVNNSAFFEATQLKDQLFNLITLQKKRPYLTDVSFVMACYAYYELCRCKWDCFYSNISKIGIVEIISQELIRLSQNDAYNNSQLQFPNVNSSYRHLNWVKSEWIWLLNGLSNSLNDKTEILKQKELFHLLPELAKDNTNSGNLKIGIIEIITNCFVMSSPNSFEILYESGCVTFAIEILSLFSETEETVNLSLVTFIKKLLAFYHHLQSFENHLKLKKYFQHISEIIEEQGMCDSLIGWHLHSFEDSGISVDSDILTSLQFLQSK